MLFRVYVDPPVTVVLTGFPFESVKERVTFPQDAVPTVPEIVPLIVRTKGFGVRVLFPVMEIGTVDVRLEYPDFVMLRV